MHTRLLVLLVFMLCSACRAVPNRREAAAAVQSGWTSKDSVAIVRVWADGPPWFSCSEVTAKLGSRKDRAVVGDALRPWRTLVLADWMRLHDTSSGPVVEPGWCVGALRDSATRTQNGWRAIAGAAMPTGDARRGWDVHAGERKVEVVERPKPLGGDSARVTYIITIAPNENGRALGVGNDTTRGIAVVSRIDGEWRRRH